MIRWPRKRKEGHDR